MFKVMSKVTEPMCKVITELPRIIPLMIIIRLIPITTLIPGSKVQFSRPTVTRLIQCLHIRIPLIQLQHTIHVHIIPHHRIIIGVNRDNRA
jgi:hypothetical protein